ncbi:MAG: Uma2 family endonuclease [Planctomycetaceae bacterium]
MTPASAIDLEGLFDQLTSWDGKAEIIDGEIVTMSPTGPWPGYAGDMIFVSLHAYAKRVKTGIAVSDNKIVRVRNSPHRQSFSPDAAYFIGAKQAMRFYDGAPVFAVEVRSAGDYGPKAEQALAAKRAEYFSAGTLVVWDVDLLSNDVIKLYRASQPDRPVIYHPGDIAEAEPAVPGWTMAVNDLLPEDWQPNFQQTN